jgi:Tfp pilus tip-associated adhesin PilY1
MVYVGANDGMLHAFYAPSEHADANYANAGRKRGHTFRRWQWPRCGAWPT